MQLPRINTTTLFFSGATLSESRAQRIINDALDGLDDGELFIEVEQSEQLSFDDCRLKNSSFNLSQGFGLRGVLGECSAYAHASEFSESALKRAAETVRAVNYGQSPNQSATQAAFGSNQPLYMADNPLDAVPFSDKIALLAKIDAYLRAKEPRIRQVSVSLSGIWQAVHILRAGGESASDIRPLVRLNVNVVAEQSGRMESGSYGAGARVLYADYFAENEWQRIADEALRQALVNLEAKPAPAGDFPLVMGNGWSGVLLHEAVGHGLEGDFNRKGSSTFSGRIGEQVAAKGVTVVDDGTLANKRGSLTIDDEGTPTSRNVLIEDGILRGYMQDRLNARLMGVKATGNGRRESYAHQPMPRMTNTFMLGGNHPQEELIASVKKGVFAKSLGGGQVDITSGKFVFSVSEAYWIEDGKIRHPIKGATLIGNGPEVMQRISMIGNDMALDEGIGTCGKGGQSVPVGVGQPSLLIDKITVGGTQA